MADKEPMKSGVFAAIILFVITCVVTIWLFHYLIEPQNRSQTFGFTLLFVCFLELLFFGYLAFLNSSFARERGVPAFYPAIGMVIGSYIAISVAIVIAYNLLSLFISSRKAYFTAVTVESVFFLVVLSSILVLSTSKKAEDTASERERKSLTNMSQIVQQAYQSLLNYRSLFDIQTYRDMEGRIKKLKERFQFCTPFGRSSADASDIEEEIRSQINELERVIDEIPSVPKEELDKIARDIDDIAIRTLQSMERREKLLIR